MHQGWDVSAGEGRGAASRREVAVDLVKAAEKCRSQTVSMTKADLIAVIADKLKFPWARAELLVDVVFDCMEQSMSRGEKIEIRATHPSYPLYPEIRLSGSMWRGPETE
jgi:Bacterial DNA-binding protein